MKCQNDYRGKLAKDSEEECRHFKSLYRNSKGMTRAIQNELNHENWLPARDSNLVQLRSLNRPLSEVMCCFLFRWEAPQMRSMRESVQPIIEPHHTHEEAHGLQAILLWSLWQGIPAQGGSTEASRHAASISVLNVIAATRHRAGHQQLNWSSVHVTERWTPTKAPSEKRNIRSEFRNADRLPQWWQKCQVKCCLHISSLRSGICLGFCYVLTANESEDEFLSTKYENCSRSCRSYSKIWHLLKIPETWLCFVQTASGLQRNRGRISSYVNLDPLRAHRMRLWSSYLHVIFFFVCELSSNKVFFFFLRFV
jgi:hypothetical protein